MELAKDFWRCGVVAAEAASIVARGSLADLPVTWLPGTAGLRYLADPFGLWREGRLHVFAEAFDYRESVGHIVVTVLDATMAVLEQRVVLREPWHLSYPFVFAAEGETWMLPEAHQSGGAWLYRATAFPFGWERAVRLPLPEVPLDATLLRHDGRWWLFYAPADPVGDRLTVLHAAFADTLTAPWTAHPANPILRDAAGARPGGTPVIVGDVPHLPLQRCTGSYGSGLRLLRLDALSPDRIAAGIVAEFGAPPSAAPFAAGCHTLSAAGPVTLIDVKRRAFSPLALAAWPVRKLRSRRRGAQFAW